MSLQVWLPLNGDLRNKGVANIGEPSYQAVTYPDGKIGKCMEGKVGWHLNNEILGNEWSVATWYLSPQTFVSSNQLIFCKNIKESNDAQIYLSIIGGTQLNLGINNSIYATATNYTFETNTWYHIAATYNGNVAKLYINGVLKSSAAISRTLVTGRLNIYLSSRSVSEDGTTPGTTGRTSHMNDFRLYDHALSAAEVKEISRGLIVHYPLDSNIQGSTCYDCSGNGYNGTITGTLGADSNSPRYSKCGDFNGSTYIRLDSPTQEIQTVSFWAKGIKNSSKSQVFFIDALSHLAFGLYASIGIIVSGFHQHTNLYSLEGFINNKWNHIVVRNNSTTIKDLYINGVLQTRLTSTNSWDASYRKLDIGSRLGQTSGSNGPIIGQISDFRAYATQLSEADILDLYQTSSKIDNTGKLHTYSIVEDSTKSFPSITRQGLTIMNNSTDGFIEDPILSNLSITKTGQLKATEIIEN